METPMKLPLILLSATLLLTACGNETPLPREEAAPQNTPQVAETDTATIPCRVKQNSIGFHTGSSELTSLGHDLILEVIEDRATDCPNGRVHIITYRTDDTDLTAARHAAILDVVTESGILPEDMEASITDPTDPEEAGRTIVTLDAE
ncbi:hypothetical protein HY11_16260 [Hyphomonas pacifica]|nr:hypothetical protein HY11_16260 [Hyphomonas pacifica]